jgi:large subunit ribosomal protein L25
MEIKVLKARAREAAQRPNSLRRDGFIPAIVYGKSSEPKQIVLPVSSFEKIYREVGETTLIDLQINGKETLKVLIQDAQKDPLSMKFSHADFRMIDMKEKLEANIPLNFIGESKAVKEFAGILNKSMDTIAVKCLPGALVSEINVDLAKLEKFGDVIRAGDVTLPEGMELVADPKIVIMTVSEPRSEKEMEELNKAVEADVSKIEVVGAKKKEDETAAAEGATDKAKEKK